MLIIQKLPAQRKRYARDFRGSGEMKDGRLNSQPGGQKKNRRVQRFLLE
ncbi:hypothetical protein HOLDEFILI_00938 [Holdemania filiformis DSM 12042]|uniref:Uncharacterized protein n=1 Tax=Holdemania filiformis DSM 12042 TaxID=545696 RepID=B9Y557_9FIRM|nr:hypothetical protein HOLDEFILI_00938 [Holdemania filiformis DSM 12042]